MHCTICVLIVALLLSSCGGGQTETRILRTLSTESVTLWVTSGEKTCPVFLHEGKPFVLAHDGAQFQVGLMNRSSVSVEVVVAVDGRDVVSGEKADYRTQRGYVLDPGESVVLKGFRESLSQVRAFTFAERWDQTGSEPEAMSNVGVIGIAVFSEKDSSQGVISRETSGLPPKEALVSSAGPEKRSFSRGEDGSPVRSEAEIVPFSRFSENQPTEVIALYYDNRAGLEARGVDVPEEVPKKMELGPPDPFPGVTGGSLGDVEDSSK